MFLYTAVLGTVHMQVETTSSGFLFYFHQFKIAFVEQIDNKLLE
jgi:hypothetical protein